MAIGVVLSQNIGGQEHVIAYASRTLTKAEKRYCVTRKELLALVHFVKYFRHYLYGKAFTVRTDHSSLRWLMNFKNPEGQMARWLEVLSAYDMKIVHRPGRLHQNADGLSRMNTCYQCGLLEAGTESLNTMHVNPVMLDDEPTTVVDIKTTQDSDADIRLVKTWITTGTRPEHRDIGSGGRLLKSMWSQWPRLSIKDGVLVRRWEVLGTDIVYWQAVVPLGQRRIVLKYTHDVKTSGHLGVLKTLSKIRQRYYWPGLQQDVRAYIAGCETCSKKKRPNDVEKQHRCRSCDQVIQWSG